MDKGKKTSEKKACYHAFYASVILALLGIYMGADLSALGILVGSVCLPLMWYAGARTGLKMKQGGKDAKVVMESPDNAKN